MKKSFLGIAIAALVLSSCASGPNVTRVEAGAQVADLSGFWNSNDVRIVTESMVSHALSAPRVQQEIAAIGGRPTVLVGSFRNLSDEHIDTGIITSSFETSIFNSGAMDFVAGGAFRDELRAERADQLIHASEATAAGIGHEVGADFMLFGTVRTVVDRGVDRRGNRTTVRTYHVFAELTSVATAQRVWMHENSEIRKVVNQPRNRL